MASLNSSRTWEVSSVAILEWQKWGGHCGAKEKSRGANINVKYCWPKVICCMGQSSELEREIKQKTGGASGVASQKSGGPCPPPRPPLRIATEYHYLHMWSHCGDSTSYCLAPASFARLSDRIFTNRDLSTRTKMAVYNAICVSTLLCACEGWTPSSHQSHRGFLHWVLSNYPARALVGQNASCRDLPQSRHNMPRGNTPQRTTGVGHVTSMRGNRLPRHLLCSELSCGRPSVGVKRSVLRATLSRP